MKYYCIVKILLFTFLFTNLILLNNNVQHIHTSILFEISGVADNIFKKSIYFKWDLEPFEKLLLLYLIKSYSNLQINT